MNSKLHLKLVFVTMKLSCFIAVGLVSLLGQAQGVELGFSFGPPALLGVKGRWCPEPLSTKYQVEYSHLILQQNRGRGHLGLVRVDIQVPLNSWFGANPFYFVGGSYFFGAVPTQSSSVNSMSLSAWNVGMGAEIPLTGSWAMLTEFGLINPTHAVSGFEMVGLIATLGLTWSFEFSEEHY